MTQITPIINIVVMMIKLVVNNADGSDGVSSVGNIEL